MLDHVLIKKLLNPLLLSKAMASFDKATLTIISIAWTTAILLMATATYTTTQAVSTRKAAAAAQAVEPVLPKIDYEQVDTKTLQSLIDRIKSQSANITISAQNNGRLKISTQDGALFKNWLMTLGYLNTAYPQYQWTIEEMCVGSCKGELMSAAIRGEKVNFSVPQQKK